MRARFSLTWAVVIVLAAFATLAGSALAKTSVRYDFEKDIQPWAGANDKGTKGFGFERATGDNGCMDVPGNSYASLKLSPAEGASAAWMVSTHKMPVPGKQTVRIQLSARDAGNCEKCVPLVFASAEKPWSGDSFKRLLPAPGDGPVPDGWTRYQFQGGVDTDGMVYVALGWKYGPPPLPPAPGFGSMLRNDYLYDELSPVRPVEASAYGFDCVSLDIYPTP